MVEPFRFRDDIPVLIGGREALLADVRERLRTTHRVTKASDASNIPADDVRRHVVAVVLDTIKDRLREPLAARLGAHMAQAVEEYELLEGEPVGSADMVWFAGKHTVLREALSVEIEGLLGTGVLMRLIGLGQGARDIANDVLAKPLADPAKALAVCGVSTADIEDLVFEVRRPPARAPDTLVMGLSGIANHVRQRLAAGGDVLELDEAVRLMLNSETEEEFTAAMTTLGIEGPGVEATLTMLDGLDPDADTQAEEIMALATRAPQAEDSHAPEPDAGYKEVIGAPPRDLTDAEALAADEQKRAKRGRKPVEGGPMTDAALSAVTAILEHSALAEQPLADKLGLSRSIMINYRKKRTAWNPTAVQLDVLQAILAEHIAGLQAGQQALELASL